MRMLARPILLWMAVLAFSLLVIFNTRFTADMSAFLPAHPTAEQAFLVDQLKGGSFSRMILMGVEGGTAAERARLSQALGKALRTDGRFSMVRNGDGAYLKNDQALLFQNRYLLSPSVTPERFTPAGLHAAIGDSIDRLNSPVGLVTKNLLTRDPTGELMSMLRSLDAGHAPHMSDGAWVSPDGQRSLLMAQTQADGSDTDAMQTAIDTIRHTFDTVRTGAGDKTATQADRLQLIVTGAPVFSVESRATIKGEVKRFSIISSVAILLLLLLVYRSISMLLLGMLPVLTGVAVAIATVSLGFGTVHGITIGFGTTLLGESIDYSIYYFIQTQGTQAAVTRFWSTIRLGVMTSVIGFAALLLSGFPGLAQIGLYSMAGLITAAVVTRFVLPRLPTPTLNTRPLRGIGEWLQPIFRRLPRLRGGVILLALIAVVVLVVRHDTIWQTGLSGLSPIPEAAKQVDEQLSTDMGAPDTRYFVVIRGDSQEAVLQQAAQASRALQPLVNTHVLSGFDSPSSFLPSQATQEARQHALPDAATLKANLDQAVQGLPIHADKLAPFVAAVEVARHQPLLTADTLKGSSFGLALDNLLQYRNGQWLALMPVRISAAKAPQDTVGTQKAEPKIGPLIERALAAGQVHDALFVDMLGASNRLYDGYLNNTITLSLLGVLGIVVLLAVTLRSPRRLLQVLTPLAIAVVLVMAGLNLLGEKLTLLHLVGLLLIVAVGSNYALFFSRGQSPDALTLASLILANLTTVIAFGTLAFSQLPILQAFGSTVAPGAWLALLLSAVFAAPGESGEPGEPGEKAAS
ncbi:MAG: MMPL family transporter [Halothiobacillus sp.]|jgi:predicted exporter|nr:MMPL family transporter [Halothiobacillus sp.]